MGRTRQVHLVLCSFYIEEEREQLIRKCVAKGMPIKEIAELLDTSVQDVRRLSKNGRR